jgi:dTDP-4-amino-4,6-dideoxygalactose transaminase
MIKLAKPIISETIIDKVAAVLRSGNLVQGNNVRDFEKSLEDYISIKHAVACSSGTAALHLSLLAMNISSGDEIICPAFTFPATANVVERSGAKVVLADVSSKDLCIDPGEVERVITKKTKAVIIVHEFGQSAQIKEIRHLVEKFGIKIIEDAACAIGTEYNGQKVGTFGFAGCFSFHPRKIITTGEGGAIVTNDDEFAARLRVFRNHGLSIKDGYHNFIEAGLNYRMTEFQAVLGLHQLAEIIDIIDSRLMQAQLYNEALAKTAAIKTPQRFDVRGSIYQTYHVIVADNINRNKLIESLRAKDIEVNIGAQALNCLDYYQKKYGFKPEDFPNATRAYRQGLALPIGTHLTEDDIKYVAGTLIDMLDNHEN